MLKLVFEGLFANLENLSTAEENVLFETVFGKLLLQIVFGD